MAKDEHTSIYKKMGEGVTKLGCELLAKKDSVAVREEKRRTLEEKSLMREYIVNHLSQQAVNNLVSLFGPTTHMELWQRHVWRKK